MSHPGRNHKPCTLEPRTVPPCDNWIALFQRRNRLILRINHLHGLMRTWTQCYPQNLWGTRQWRRVPDACRKCGHNSRFRFESTTWVPSRSHCAHTFPQKVCTARCLFTGAGPGGLGQSCPCEKNYAGPLFPLKSRNLPRMNALAYNIVHKICEEPASSIKRRGWARP